MIKKQHKIKLFTVIIASILCLHSRLYPIELTFEDKPEVIEFEKSGKSIHEWPGNQQYMFDLKTFKIFNKTQKTLVVSIFVSSSERQFSMSF